MDLLTKHWVSLIYTYGCRSQLSICTVDMLHGIEWCMWSGSSQNLPQLWGNCLNLGCYTALYPCSHTSTASLLASLYTTPPVCSPFPKVHMKKTKNKLGCCTYSKLEKKKRLRCRSNFKAMMLKVLLTFFDVTRNWWWHQEAVRSRNWGQLHVVNVRLSHLKYNLQQNA